MCTVFGKYCSGSAAACDRRAYRIFTLLLALVAFAHVGLGQERAGQAQVLSLAPVSFIPSNNDARYVIQEGGLGALCSLKGAGYFTAVLHLDNGAAIERVSVLVEDKNTKSFALMSLVRRTPMKSELLAITTVSSSAHEVETLSADQIADPVVHNETYSYLLQVTLSGPGVCLRGAEVTYRTPS